MAASAWANCSKNAETASQQFAKAAAAAKTLGRSTAAYDRAKAEMDAVKKTAEERRKAAEKNRDNLNKEADSQDKKESEAAAKKKERDALVAKAVAAWNSANTAIGSGNSYYNSKQYGRAKASYTTAAQLMADAAYWYGEAAPYASSDADKRDINQRKTKANEWKSTATQKANACEGFVKAQADLATEQAAVPATPSVSYEQGDTTVCMEIDCSAKWSTELRVYRDVNGRGEWHVVHVIKRVLAQAYNDRTGRQEPVGTAWTRQMWCDRDIADGNVYRYCVRSATVAGIVSEHSTYSQGFATKPQRAEGLELALAGYDDEGKADVRVSWSNTSASATSIEVQYTAWHGKRDAWEEGALDRISTATASSPTATVHTLTGIEPGRKLYVRVRSVNSSGSAWAYVSGMKDRNGVTASIDVPAMPEPALNVPSGLKAVLASETAVRLSWTDKLESGANYSIEHSANPQAWEQNAVGDITVIEYEDASGGQASSSAKTYTVTGLEPGKRYFRVSKSKGAGKVWAQTATGDGMATQTMCFAEVPAPVVPSVQVPTNVAAAKSSDSSIFVSWADSEQSAGDTYEVRSADYASAFEDNAAGDITVVETELLRYTLTSLARGRTWYIGVRKKSASGVSQWSQTVDVALEGETLREPTGLKLEGVDGDYTRLNATWEDAPEDGATYTMRVAPSMRAFANNAVGEITESEYDPGSSTAAEVCQYEFTGLTPGTTYYVQAVKKKDELTRRAKAASGPTMADEHTAFLELPAQPVPTIPVPTGVIAEPRTAGGELVTEGDGDKAAVKVSWRDQQASGDSYEVSYTNDAEAFADNAIGYIQSINFDGSGGEMHSVAATGLDRGRTWYFRVRKKTAAGQGAWSSTATCYLEPVPEPAEELAPPTTVDTLGGYAADEDVALAWTHNSAQASTQSGYQIEVSVTEVGGAPTVHVVEAQEETSDNVYVLDLAEWGVSADGTKVEWRVRTSGAQFHVYSPWSRIQTFRVFARPAAYVQVDAEPTSYPFAIAVRAESSGGGEMSDSNAPISYTVEIAAAESYERVGTDGLDKYVAEGQVLFARSVDSRDEGFSPDGWAVSVGAGDVLLVGGIRYKARGTVATAQGMRSSAEAEFTPMFEADVDQPWATVSFDDVTYTARIEPYCGEVGGDVEDEDEEDIPGEETMTRAESEAVQDWPDEGVFYDFTDDSADEPFAEEIGSRFVGELREGTTLSVYRVARDGSLVEIATGLPNDAETCCVDPHPDFGKCTYRIVATDTATGIQAADDVTVDVPVERIVVQWDERWVEGGNSPFASLHAGHMLELDHNAESSETFAPDAALRAYAGREHPVSYYGTQKGQAASVSGAFIVGFEEESLAAFRSLAAWGGDCYVRTPDGLGCWANVRAGLSHPKGSKAATATLEVTRVEGGK